MDRGPGRGRGKSKLQKVMGSIQSLRSLEHAVIVVYYDDMM